MGSGASSQVKAIGSDSTKNTSKEERTTGPEFQTKCETRVSDLNTPTGSILTSDEAIAKLKDLEKQLAESESENLDLQDRIQNLEERLTEQLKVIPEEEICTETLQAKDQYISKLEQELHAAQQENSKMKIRHKKKTKSMMSQLTEAKQGLSIEMFELRDEVNRLREENQMLRNKIDQTSAVSGVPSADIAPSISGSMSLILDLSQQVSEQQEKIRRLEETVKEKNQKIKKFKSSKLSTTDGSCVLKDEVLISTSWDDQPQAGSHSEFLSGGWQSVTDSSTAKNSNSWSGDLAPVEECSMEDDVKCLSRSQDSGIGSAGKMKTLNTGSGLLNVDKRIASASSLLSGLAHDDSDSDWGSDSTTSAPNKSQSAPPGFRSPHILPPSGKGVSRGDYQSNGTSMSRSRKKKSVLRSKIDQIREFQSDDVCHRSELLGPTLAFVDST